MVEESHYCQILGHLSDRALLWIIPYSNQEHHVQIAKGDNILVLFLAKLVENCVFQLQKKVSQGVGQTNLQYLMFASYPSHWSGAMDPPRDHLGNCLPGIGWI